jgi:hypothetical protein
VLQKEFPRKITKHHMHSKAAIFYVRQLHSTLKDIPLQQLASFVEKSKIHNVLLARYGLRASHRKKSNWCKQKQRFVRPLELGPRHVDAVFALLDLEKKLGEEVKNLITVPYSCRVHQP